MAEAAGLALAVLPLLISAVEHYEHCLRPIKCFCDFTSQAKQFCKRFDIQKTIFRNQCRLLLQDIVEQEVAQSMLLDQRHPYWIDAEMTALLERQLEASRDSCVAVIEDILAVLAKLQNWSSRLGDAVENDGKAHRFGSRAWRSLARTKLKLGFSEQPLSSTLAELRELNDSFLTLSSQTSKLHQQEKTHSVIKPLARDIEKVRSVQRASREIHEALGRSCSKHSEHRTHFCLEAKTRGSVEHPQIQFRVAFSRATVRGTRDPCDPVFFIIESFVHHDTGTTIQESQSRPLPVVSKLKRALDSNETVQPKKIKKAVKFQMTGCSDLPHQLPAGEIETLKDLCMNSNFCDRLRECMQQSCDGLRYLGTLGDTNPYRHLVYFPEKKTQRPALSLQEVISITSRRDPSTRLSMYERLHLARSLATAVLQYHATPWLRRPWRCKDIYFFGAEERLLPQQSPSPISEPHIDVSITNSNIVLPISVGKSADHLAPNVILFNLGVMLIELAYTATLRNLLTEKEQSYRDSHYTEFLAARRLGEVVAREMGPKYSKIVQKCLGCHFASGADLNSPELQAEYHRDVVQELEKLDEDFASLKIGG